MTPHGFTRTRVATAAALVLTLAGTLLVLVAFAIEARDAFTGGPETPIAPLVFDGALCLIAAYVLAPGSRTRTRSVPEPEPAQPLVGPLHIHNTPGQPAGPSVSRAVVKAAALTRPGAL